MTRSPITVTAGDLRVEAEQAGNIDATANTTVEAWTTQTAIAAFNAVGWKSQNLLFNLLDALLGGPVLADEVSGEAPARAWAIVTDSPLDVPGEIFVTATSVTGIAAMAGNENSVEAVVALLFPGVDSPSAQGGRLRRRGRRRRPALRDEQGEQRRTRRDRLHDGIGRHRLRGSDRDLRLRRGDRRFAEHDRAGRRHRQQPLGRNGDRRAVAGRGDYPYTAASGIRTLEVE